MIGAVVVVVVAVYSMERDLPAAMLTDVAR